MAHHFTPQPGDSFEPLEPLDLYDTEDYDPDAILGFDIDMASELDDDPAFDLYREPASKPPATRSPAAPRPSGSPGAKQPARGPRKGQKPATKPTSRRDQTTAPETAENFYNCVETA